jgi:hypothetical protein
MFKAFFKTHGSMHILLIMLWCDITCIRTSKDIKAKGDFDWRRRHLYVYLWFFMAIKTYGYVMHRNSKLKKNMCSLPYKFHGDSRAVVDLQCSRTEHLSLY